MTLLYLSNTGETDIKPTPVRTRRYIASNRQESVGLKSVWSQFGGVTEVSPREWQIAEKVDLNFEVRVELIFFGVLTQVLCGCLFSC